MRREGHDRHRGPGLAAGADGARGRQPIQAGHVEVHEHDVEAAAGFQLLQHAHAVVDLVHGGAGLAQVGGHGAPVEGAVVGQQHPAPASGRGPAARRRAALDGPLQRLRQRQLRARLAEEALHAGALGLDPGHVGRLAGVGHDAHVAVGGHLALAHAQRHLVAVEHGHVQVEQDDVVGVARHQLQRALAVRRLVDHQAQRPQLVAGGDALGGVVLDQQQALAHQRDARGLEHGGPVGLAGVLADGREAQAELGELAQRRFAAHLAAERLHHPLAIRQAQAGAARLADRAERLEQAGQHLARDAGPVVAHPDVVAADRDVDPDARVRPDVVQRVLDQVEQHEQERGLVAAELEVVQHLHPDPAAGLLAVVAVLVDRLAHHLGRRQVGEPGLVERPRAHLVQRHRDDLQAAVDGLFALGQVAVQRLDVGRRHRRHLAAGPGRPAAPAASPPGCGGCAPAGSATRARWSRPAPGWRAACARSRSARWRT
jgi:hypothetical protein